MTLSVVLSLIVGAIGIVLWIEGDAPLDGLDGWRRATWARRSSLLDLTI